MYLAYLTRGGSSPRGKSRVWIACHPEEQEKYLKTIAQDLFATQNCAVWYTEEAHLPDDVRDDLVQMQLIVVVVTRRLLTTENDVLDVIVPFANAEHIPLLPIMVEQGLDGLFSEKIGDLQYLLRENADPTAIPYPERLALYLQSVLPGEDIEEKISAAFDAYIFLSYRKKDRAHAQSLMRLIHEDPFCERVAIWYDEFLTPGEDFNVSIEKALQKSDLFTLVVTPNLVNEDNYIMRIEYPMAHAAGKAVAPVEMVETQADALQTHYPDIPAAVDGHDRQALSTLLHDHLAAALRTQADDPVHGFFVGLAYLYGIDVEVDRARAVRLITAAAEAGIEAAEHQLVQMYWNGQGVPRDTAQALHWQEHLTDRLSELADESQDEGDAMRSLEEHLALADMTLETKDYETADAQYETAQEIAKVLAFGAFGKSILQKAKRFVQKYTGKSPYQEPALKATSRAALRRLEIELRVQQGQGIGKRGDQTAVLVENVFKMYGDAQSAADYLTFYRLTIEICEQNSLQDMIPGYLDKAAACWSRLPEAERTPEVRRCYAALLGAVRQGEGAARQRQQAMLEALCAEYPEELSYRCDMIRGELAAARESLPDQVRAERHLTKAEEMIAQHLTPEDSRAARLMLTARAVGGHLQALRGDYDAAVKCLLGVYEALRPMTDAAFDVENVSEEAEVCETIGDCKKATGDLAEADRWYRCAVDSLTELSLFVMSLTLMRTLARLYEKLLDVALAREDVPAVREWEDKARYIRERLVSFDMGKDHPLDKTEDIAASQALAARKQEIRTVLQEAPLPDETLLAFVKKPLPAPVGRLEAERAIAPVAEAYLKMAGDVKLYQEVEKLCDELRTANGKPAEIALCADRIVDQMLDKLRPYLWYTEEAMLILSFCGHHRIVTPTFFIGGRDKALQQFRGFFRSLPFWERAVDTIHYPEVWRVLYHWIEEDEGS